MRPLVVQECAARMVELLGDERRREAFGDAAREHMRREYSCRGSSATS